MADDVLKNAIEDIIKEHIQPYISYKILYEKKSKIVPSCNVYGIALDYNNYRVTTWLDKEIENNEWYIIYTILDSCIALAEYFGEKIDFFYKMGTEY